MPTPRNPSRSGYAPSAYLAEFLGTAILVATILGTGHMSTRLGAGEALGLVIAALAAGAVLFVIISVFQGISGAHFNPAVSLVMVARGDLRPLVGLGYLGSQGLGAVLGAVVANAVFGATAIVVSEVKRDGWALLLSEFIATWGLVLVIVLLIDAGRATLVPGAVAAWIVAGHLFLSSTSFANPAVTFGRMLSDAPNGIAAFSVPGFIGAQLAGALVAWGVAALLTPRRAPAAQAG
jgi:glycerol uptake facilitator-like aquaporin